jgi:methionine synthase I (cobalamin-dependent)
VRLALWAGETEQAQVFSEQIAAQVAEGVDLLILETFSDLAEIEQAIAAARSVCDPPITASVNLYSGRPDYDGR